MISKQLFLRLEKQLKQFRLKTDKKKSQNFIVDNKVLEQVIFFSELKKTDVVLEIGCGTGFLTELLAKKTGKVLAVEKDEKFKKLLKTQLKNKNIKFFFEDILTAKIPYFNKCISFPPYHLSKKIVLFLIKKRPQLCVIVFQKEFAEKLFSEPGFWDYSALSVETQHAFEIIPGPVIKSKSFFPKPKTDSRIVILKRKKRFFSKEKEKRFFKLLEEIFRYKNKNIEKALKHAEKSFQNIILPKNIAGKKVNLLTPGDLRELFKLIEKKQKIGSKKFF